MMFKQTLRWFGPQDPITLKEIKQTGATGIVTALHHIPVGKVWSIEEINKRKNEIEAEGLTWSVVESLPVHENIKKRNDNYQELIKNYRQSIINLSKCGISTICYNFMPVLDWSRTNLRVVNRDGSITSKFVSNIFRAFDVFILKRDNVEKEYTHEQIDEARFYYESLTQKDKDWLTETILYGLPGSLDVYTLDEFRKAISEYDEIGDKELRENLYYFINEILPTAEELNVRMAIHPDDPPWSLLGLPRIVGNRNDFEKIVSAYDSYSNGFTFCTGSLGASIKNDIVDMTKTFADRINFVHLRNVSRDKQNNFKEEYHLEGEIDLYNVMRELLLEQKRRKEERRKDYIIPLRPDHGHLMIPEMNKAGIYPGYSLFGRMRGLAELRGMELAILKSLED